MLISANDAKAVLTDLLERAEAGEDIVLTRNGRPNIRLVPVAASKPAVDRSAAIEAIRARAAKYTRSTDDASKSQDFLYDETGLPG